MTRANLAVCPIGPPIGGLYTVSRGAVVAFSIAFELAAIPFFLRVRRSMRAGEPLVVA